MTNKKTCNPTKLLGNERCAPRFLMPPPTPREKKGHKTSQMYLLIGEYEDFFFFCYLSHH